MIDKDHAIEQLRNALAKQPQTDEIRTLLAETEPSRIIKGPTVMTDEIVDAPRGILQLAYQGSLKYAQIKEHLRMRGDDVSNWWPAFADEYEGKQHVTKAGMAILIYSSMTAVVDK